MQSIYPSSSSTDASGTPAGAQVPTPASGSPLLDSAVRGVHETVDRVAAKVSPAIEQLVGSAHSATDSAQQRARELGETGHEWAETLRATVREHPLACVAAALAVGLLVSRIAAGDRY